MMTNYTSTGSFGCSSRALEYLKNAFFGGRKIRTFKDRLSDYTLMLHPDGSPRYDFSCPANMCGRSDLCPAMTLLSVDISVASEGSALALPTTAVVRVV